MKRRTLLSGAASTLAMPALAADNKPDKLVYVGDNGPWHFAMVEEVAPAFEKETGIKIDFTLLPVDPWQARLKAELNAGSSGIDIVQWSVGMAGWLNPHFEDQREVVVERIKKRDPAWNFDDFLDGSKKAATYQDKMNGIPYRITTGIMHYQKPLLEQAGITKLPETFAELQAAVIACNKPPERYGFGLMGKQSSAITNSFVGWLYSCGGRLIDFSTGEIFVNNPAGIAALEFWSDLVVKYKAVPPDAMTWEYEEIISGAQRDRYAMCQSFAPYATLMNDPAKSQTGGKWTWATMPGRNEKSQGRTWVDGHMLGVPKYSKNQDWAVEFIRMCCNQHFMHRSMVRGNAPPRGSVLRDPELVAKLGWPPVAAAAIETGIATPAHPAYTTLEPAFRAGLSQAILGQKTPKEALDEVAAEWKRGLRRAGIKAL